MIEAHRNLPTRLTIDGPDHPQSGHDSEVGSQDWIDHGTNPVNRLSVADGQPTLQVAGRASHPHTRCARRTRQYRRKRRPEHTLGRAYTRSATLACLPLSPSQNNI